ncbi:MAG: acyltransferase [Rhodomicrobium sp.]
MVRTSFAIANLRALTILFVVSFHSVLAYLGSQPASQLPFDVPPYPWRAFPILDNERWFGFDLYCAFLYVFLMPLMFFISGLFVWPSLSRKGAKTFSYGRVWRIGVPFVVAAVLLMPVAHYPVYRVTATDPSWSAFWEHWLALPFWPTGPLWFLWQILLLDLIAAALFSFAPGFAGQLGRLSVRASASPVRYLLGFTVLSIIAYLPLASIFKPWEWSQFGPFSLQSAQVTLFAVYFFAGVTAGANGFEHGLLEPKGMLASRWRLWLGLSIPAFLSWIAVTTLTVQSKTPVLILEWLSSILFAVSSATACFALIAIFLRFLGQRSLIADNLSQNAYGIYLVHYPFVIWLQYLLLGLTIFAVIKGAIVFIGALALSWALAIGFSRMPVAGRVVFANAPRSAASATRQILK